jgi:hypothetical protein
MTAPELEPMSEALEEALAELERAILANDYKRAARQNQAAIAQQLEVYQAVVAVLPRDHKLVSQVGGCLRAISRPLTRVNAGIAASAIGALLVTHAFHFPSRAAARRSQS